MWGEFPPPSKRGGEKKEKNMTLQMILALGIFLICLIFIFTEKINKTIVALGGATLYMVLQFVPQDKAFTSCIDWNVIFLLIGMMIMVGIIKDSGLFEYIAIYLAKKSLGNPKIIIIALFMVSGIISAFIDSVSATIIIAPISILIAVELGISPIPFVIAGAIAANIGGTATLIGDPANLMIASEVNFSFLDYLQNIFLFVMFLLAVSSGVIYLFFRKQLVVPNERRARVMEFNEKELLRNKPLVIYSLVTFAIFLALLIFQKSFHLPPATIALLAAMMMLFKTRPKDFEHFICHEIHWGTILFFIGLFIMVGALEESGIIPLFSEQIKGLTKNDDRLLAVFIIWIPGFIASFVDNVPYVATMLPVLKGITSNVGVWWAFVLGAVLSGNGSLLGSTASIVSVGISKKSGYPISFWKFTKYSAVITVITFALSTAFILLRYSWK